MKERKNRQKKIRGVKKVMKFKAISFKNYYYYYYFPFLFNFCHQLKQSIPLCRPRLKLARRRSEALERLNLASSNSTNSSFALSFSY